MTKLRTGFVTGAMLAAAGTAPSFAMEGVVASIKPVHSLVAAVMQGVAEPALIVTGAGSPHTYSLRPSEAQAIEDARLVFWVGSDLERFLEDSLKTLAAEATVVELSRAEGLTRLEYREGGPFDAHDHGHEPEHDHDHAHDHETGSHGHDHEAASSGQDHDHDHDHDHGHYDQHFWLDPENAKAFTTSIEQALATADPANAEAYATNADALRSRLDDLVVETQAQVDAIDRRGFVVFHDAYHYYEHRFGIEAAGSITVSPDSMPGARRIGEIQERVRTLDAACVFSEPQFEPKLIDVVTEGTDARAGVLDPLGAELEDGPELYFELIGNLTTSLTDCLQQG